MRAPLVIALLVFAGSGFAGVVADNAIESTRSSAAPQRICATR
jgi:hypothetical protein